MPDPDGARGAISPDRALGRRLLPLLALLGALALFFSPAWLGKGQFLARDSGRAFAPVKRLLAEELRQGHLLTWNPYNGLGTPIIGGAVDTALHPSTLLYALVPFPVAFKATFLACYLLAALGAFLWARQLGRGRAASVACGLGFALSGYLVSSSDNLPFLCTLSAIPLLFAAAHRYLKDRGLASLAFVGLASYLCASGGEPVGWAITTLCFPIYGAAMVAERGERVLAARRGAMATLGAALGAAPVIAPILFWLSSSNRTEPLDLLERLWWNLAPARLPELFAPFLLRGDPGVSLWKTFMVYAGDGGAFQPWALSIYLGASLLALAVLGAAVDRRARILLLSAALFAWMAMGPHAGFGEIAARLPVLAHLRYWEKMVFWVSLLVAVAAAFGIDALARPTIAHRSAIGFGAAALLLLLCAFAIGAAPGSFAGWVLRPAAPFDSPFLVPGDVALAARDYAENLRQGLLHAGVMLALLALVALLARTGRLGRTALVLAALVAALDLAAANAGAYLLLPPYWDAPPSGVMRYLSDRPGLQRIATPLDPTHRFLNLPRYESTVLFSHLSLYSGFNAASRVGNFHPYFSMLPARPARFIRRTGGYGYAGPPLGLFGVEYVLIPRSLGEAARARLLPPLDLALYDEGLGAYLVRIPHRPRAYLAKALTSVDRRGAMEFILHADPAKTAGSVVEGTVPLDYSPPEAEVEMQLDRPERVALITRASGPGLLILNDTFCDGWTAEVDGRASPIVAANYLARGVWVPEGRHEVVFTYHTPGLLLGLALIALGALLLLSFAFLRSRRPPGQPIRLGARREG